jgi:hypothetical protein
MSDTKYIVSVPGYKGSGPSYLEVLADNFYSWTGRHGKAKRFVGRAAAEAAAASLEAQMLANGYKARVTVKPATGGMPISRRLVKA